VLIDSGGLVLARDSLGIKSLYYGYKDEKPYLASETKALTGVAQEIKGFLPGHIYTAKLGFQRFIPKVTPPDFETRENFKHPSLPQLVSVLSPTSVRSRCGC